MLERHHIEGRPAEMIAENLQDAYNELLITAKCYKLKPRLAWFFLIAISNLIRLTKEKSKDLLFSTIKKSK
jgi:hypothetical protein